MSINCPECGAPLEKMWEGEFQGATHVVLHCNNEECILDWTYAYKVKGNIIEIVEPICRFFHG